MSTHVVADTAALTGRSLRHITRSPDTIITTTIMPIGFMLLFVFVFGGAIDAGTGPYVDYLLPGILIITIASGVSYTAYRLFLDLKGGMVERFQSMPIARSAVLWAHVLTSMVALAISVVVVVISGVVMGFRPEANLLAGQPVGNDIWVALAWCVGLLAIAYFLATRAYRKKLS